MSILISRQMACLIVCMILVLMRTGAIANGQNDADARVDRKLLVIAHRGASGYLPEHTLAATALAHGTGADFIEQDVVLTRDDQPIVLHDIHLDTVTNVAKVFPDRHREDGRFYAIDFALAEIRRLAVSERIDHKTGKPVYPGRFPQGASAFQIPTLSEAIELIRGLNQSTGKDVGIYPEIKKPRWHREQGKDISKIVLPLLAHYGYTTKDDNVYLQCFDPVELRRVRKELGCRLRLVQLIGSNDWNEAAVDYETLTTRNGLRTIAEYADGIGPWMPYILTSDASGRPPERTPLVGWAHDAGLIVHPFTFRADALPEWAADFPGLIRQIQDADVDGVFTDQCDQVLQAISTNRD